MKAKAIAAVPAGDRRGGLTQTLYLPKGWMLRLVDELSCPSCGRAIRIYHADWLSPGLRFICQGCHIDLLSFEQTQWHHAELPL